MIKLELTLSIAFTELESNYSITGNAKYTIAGCSNLYSSYHYVCSFFSSLPTIESMRMLEKNNFSANTCYDDTITMNINLNSPDLSNNFYACYIEHKNFPDFNDLKQNSIQIIPRPSIRLFMIFSL